MQLLDSSQYSHAQTLFAPLSEFHLSAASVLNGTARGKAWVDDPENPHVGFMIGPEGHYLAGDPELSECYQALKEIIPFKTYLIFHPAGWEAKLEQIWVNRVARRHDRLHLLFQQPKFPNYREFIPEGYQLKQVDKAFLMLEGMQGMHDIQHAVEDWGTLENYLAHGFGFCTVSGDTITSWCHSDCYQGQRCEMGINTDIHHRRKGLGSIATAAAVDYCLAHGYTEIGWQCLKNNTGSIGVAEKVGFAIEREYFAFSSLLPTENVGDLSQAECEDWATHYEKHSQTNIWLAYRAAQAWGLAGDAERSLLNLRRLLEGGWKGRRSDLDEEWKFTLVQDHPEYRSLMAALRQQATGLYESFS